MIKTATYLINDTEIRKLFEEHSIDYFCEVDETSSQNLRVMEKEDFVRAVVDLLTDSTGKYLTILLNEGGNQPSTLKDKPTSYEESHAP